METTRKPSAAKAQSPIEALVSVNKDKRPLDTVSVKLPRGLWPRVKAMAESLGRPAQEVAAVALEEALVKIQARRTQQR